MRIDEITIDGFKSYAKRVNVQGFDSHFNAITGLNGSGKSNILDSICFVLGIKNLSAVRCSNLQELVYKQGQAGITKATVSITFDNSNRASSPTGYEDKKKIVVTRQIVVGGRDKYLINGANAQTSRVQDMFHSVQLNVNNPHFLIMQGRITKVLNMKPAEILGLLEEAAGTKMYDKKREAALKTLEKKEKRLFDIDGLLEEEMLPALEKLRKERAEYMEWQQACTDAEMLGHVVIAYRYWQALSAALNGERATDAIHSDLAQLQQQRDEFLADSAAKVDEIKALKTEMELQSGGEMEEVGKQVDSTALRLAKTTGRLDAKREDSQACKVECDKLEALLEEVSEASVAAVVAEATEKSDTAKAALAQAEHSVEAAARELAGAESGDGRDESNRSLPEQVQVAESSQKQAEAQHKQATMKAKHLKTELARATKDVAAKQKEDSKLQREHQEQTASVAHCESALASLVVDNNRATHLQETVQREELLVQDKRRLCQNIAASVGHLLDFNYQDPRPGFDRNQVKGVLARLVHIESMEGATALEVAAGAKLTHIVVDSATTGGDLIKRGGLKKRYTFVPLDKTRTNPVSVAKRSTAARITENRSKLALELVGHDPEVRIAMEYAFGNSFVCTDSQAAKKVAFSREVAVRGISLAGDDFSPSGTLTGGSRGRNTPTLSRLHELAAAESELAHHQTALQAAQAELAQLAGALHEQQKLQERLELARHALKLVEARVEGSASHQAQISVNTLTTQLEEAVAEAAAASQQAADSAALVVELKKRIKNFDGERGNFIKQAKAKQEKARKAVEVTAKSSRALEQKVQEVLAQQDSAASERASLTEQLKEAKKEADSTQKTVEELEAEVKVRTETLDKLNKELASHKERLARCHADLASLTQDKRDLESCISEGDLRQKKLQHRLAKSRKEVEDVARQTSALEKECGWLVKEKPRLGKPDGPYHFEKLDMKQKEQQYACAVNSKNERGRAVNRSVLVMFEQCEKDYTSLMTRRRTVLNDRDKIKSVIEELDTKKETALEMTWHKVNTDFGDIFKTLLPGTQAKLQPPEGVHFLEGLEVCVAFGGVWKESLSELSGGQRSLLALSLILSLLRFRPAPLYILDEVDAALDLSHTQNIGRMIKNYFPFAQFIVVSLKEGMFNNANVIFRTRFIDGSSTVSRSTNTQAALTATKAAQPPAKKGRKTDPKDVQQENVSA